MRLSPRERWIGFFAVAAAALYVWFTLQPDLLLSNTTTNGGDTGAHVWWPAYLRDHILPKWRLTGWTPDQPLLDPMCGSGSLLVEAAQIARRIPPGHLRSFAFENGVATQHNRGV